MSVKRVAPSAAVLILLACAVRASDVEGPCGRLELDCRVRFVGHVEGAGLALLSTREFGVAHNEPVLPAWEEPNLPGTFSIGLDTDDPPTRDPFDAKGNIYGRPQHEVSLHWDNLEVANSLSPVAYEDGRWHDFRLAARFEVGGAYVSVSVDGSAVYSDFFIAGLVPYVWRPAFGTNEGTAGGSCRYRLLRVVREGEPPAQPEPDRRHAVQAAVLTADHQFEEQQAELPLAGRRAARIIATLTLSAPPGGIDPWDRAGSVYAWDDEGNRIEVFRFITPFGREYTWKLDVTDYQSILRGSRRMGVSVGTWVKGWQVDVYIDYFWGVPEREAIRVTNLWSGDWEYGNPADPVDARFEPRLLTLDRLAAAAKLRLVVTGHGMSPNTSNAAEFMPAGRRVTVNGRRYESLLWTSDSYLNPCRPQGGTWKYDRAGWGPGAPVRPWDIDLTGLARPGGLLHVTYEPAPYVNENAGNGRASHLVEAQLIQYR